MPAEPVDILLFVEHVARELDIACAVKHLVQRRHGLRIEVASLAWRLEDTFGRYQPAVVVMPYCYSQVDFATHQILPVWPDASYVSLSYEQVFQQIQKGHKAPRDRFSRAHVLHHAWGDFYAGFLKESGVPPENIVVNGNPTYQLYLPPYRDYFISRAELAGRYHLDPARRWLLVPENYGVGFLNDRQLASRYGQFRGTAAEGFRDFAADSFRAAAKWWRKAGDLPGVEMILRPRPATPREKIMQALTEDGATIPPHMHVIKQETAREWILAADVVASSYSTTLIESAVAEKPILMLEPIPFPEYMHAEWYDLVPRVATEEAFLEAARGPGPGQTYRPLQDWAHRNMLSRGDVIANIAALLAAVRRKQRPVPVPPGIGILKERPKEPIGKRLRGLLSRAKHALIRIPGKSWEADEITDAELARRLARWEHVLG